MPSKHSADRDGLHLTALKSRDVPVLYRVTIRGVEPDTNTNSCSDFATNTLSTCKHLEVVLARSAFVAIQ